MSETLPCKARLESSQRSMPTSRKIIIPYASKSLKVRSAMRSRVRSLCAFDLSECSELFPWSRGLPQKLTAPQLLKKFPSVYETWRFITAFTIARHLSLSWARSIQSMPLSHFSKIHFNVLPSTSGSSRWYPFPLAPVSFIETSYNKRLISTHYETLPYVGSLLWYPVTSSAVTLLLLLRGPKHFIQLFSPKYVSLLFL
jgi:hypothetical protein